MKQYPIPGTVLMPDAEVTQGMRDYALELLHDPMVFMGSTMLPLTIDGVELIARIEVHPAEPSIPHEHRGVTLYKVVGPVMAEGIDISGYQPNVDWEHVRRSANFVFIKASEGTMTKDQTFESHWSGAAGVDLLKGAYHFFRPRSDAQAQANQFLATIQGKTLDLPPVLDVEVDSGCSPAAIVAGVSQWLSIVGRALRMRTMVYTMPSYWDSRVGTGVDQNLADLWVAHWDVSKPTKPRGWTDYSFWQYSSSTGAPGVGPAMDVNRFCGTVDELLKYSTDLARS